MVQDFLFTSSLILLLMQNGQTAVNSHCGGEFLLYTPVLPDFVVYIFVGHNARTLRTVNVLLKASDIVSYCK